MQKREFLRAGAALGAVSALSMLAGCASTATRKAHVVVVGGGYGGVFFPGVFQHGLVARHGKVQAQHFGMGGKVLGSNAVGNGVFIAGRSRSKNNISPLQGMYCPQGNKVWVARANANAIEYAGGGGSMIHGKKALRLCRIAAGLSGCQGTAHVLVHESVVECKYC